MNLPTQAKRAYIQSVVRASSDLSLLNPAGVCAPERGVSESRPCQGSALVIWVQKITAQKRDGRSMYRLASFLVSGSQVGRFTALERARRQLSLLHLVAHKSR